MTYSDLMNILLTRAKRLGLTDDAAELESYLWNVLIGLIGQFDLDAYTTIDDAMFVTSPSVEGYPLPTDFGRFLHLTEAKSAREGLTGLYLDDGSSRLALSYRRPQTWNELDRTTTGTPNVFTITGRTLRLNPPPNSNNGTHYRGRGEYIQQIERFDLDDEVPLTEPACLVSQSLYQLASDTPTATASQVLTLQREATQDKTALVNNQARLRLQFHNYRHPTRAGRA